MRSASDKVRTLLEDIDATDSDKQRIAEKTHGLLSLGLPTDQAFEHARREVLQQQYAKARLHGTKGIRNGKVPQAQEGAVDRA